MAPLFRQNFPGVEHVVFGVVHMGGFGGEGVQFQDFKFSPGFQGFKVGCADIKSAKMKAVEILHDPVDTIFQFGCVRMPGVQEERTSTMGADFHQFYFFPGGGNFVESLTIGFQV